MGTARTYLKLAALCLLVTVEQLSAVTDAISEERVRPASLNSPNTSDHATRGAGTRTVTFGGNCAQFTLRMGPGPNTDAPEWKVLGTAGKTVQVPPGMYLELVGSPHVSNLSALRSLRGDDLLSLDLTKAAITDDQLASISNLTGLMRLKLGGTEIGDRGLAYLKRMSKMCALKLAGTLVTDKGLVILRNMPSLAVLNCDNTHINGSGLINLKPTDGTFFLLDLTDTSFDDRAISALKNIPHFTCLLLGGTKITNNGIAKLLKQCTFTNLDLSRTGITGTGFASLGNNWQTLVQLRVNDTGFDDKGMASVGQCKNIAWLYLSNTAITDAAMPYIGTLSRLQYLHLRGTRLSDAAVPYIERLTSLKELELPNGISRAGVLKLRGALPGCKIRRAHVE